jgi:hypothetical protein
MEERRKELIAEYIDEELKEAMDERRQELIDEELREQEEA